MFGKSKLYKMRDIIKVGYSMTQWRLVTVVKETLCTYFRSPYMPPQLLSSDKESTTNHPRDLFFSSPWPWHPTSQADLSDEYERKHWLHIPPSYRVGFKHRGKHTFPGVAVSPWVPGISVLEIMLWLVTWDILCRCSQISACAQGQMCSAVLSWTPGHKACGF
jgi:hypothetical protein